MRGSVDVLHGVFEGAAGKSDVRGVSQGCGIVCSECGKGPVEEMRWGVARVKGLL